MGLARGGAQLSDISNILVDRQKHVFQFFYQFVIFVKTSAYSTIILERKISKNKRIFAKKFSNNKNLHNFIVRIDYSDHRQSVGIFVLFFASFPYYKVYILAFFGKCSTIFFLSKNKFLSEYWLVGLERAIKWRWGFTKRSKFDCTNGDVCKNVWLLSGGTGHKSYNWTHSAGFKRAMERRRGLT